METEVDRIRLLFFDDPTAMTLALKNREIDVAEFPSATFMALKDDIQAGEVKDLSYYSGLSPTGDFTYIGFNLENTTTFSHKNNATRDPSVRTALAMAVGQARSRRPGLPPGPCRCRLLSRLPHLDEVVLRTLRERADRVQPFGCGRLA